MTQRRNRPALEKQLSVFIYKAVVQVQRRGNVVPLFVAALGGDGPGVGVDREGLRGGVSVAVASRGRGRDWIRK